jgi:hypothetical protein
MYSRRIISSSHDCRGHLHDPTGGCITAGISVMARLTFNLLDYNEFYNHALGLGTSTSAVTTLFWISVILLQVS